MVIYEEMVMQKKKKLLDVVRDKIRFKHYSIKTEQLLIFLGVDLGCYCLCVTPETDVRSKISLS